ncbi:MAG TPA: dynamin family protein [Spirochaetota bacterium]|nr:dynamin family protein [Spirochaetota bacterium]HPC43043.1 dynamin family protein [Spirochaetota bacterium]HPL17719.1 dynamin family protein [Spirochaetota bacterium]HQF09453.1 dynamin family protein [Spirochaetota bacterium]HQH98136.1 dynamin family protein [Spirochaetota bacterium]
MIENAVSLRERAISAIHVVEAVSTEFNLQSIEKVAGSVLRFVNEQRYLDIAVLGQFKAGKSSFLNALTGTAVLPVGSIPVTSVITRLSPGENNRALVTFNGGGVRETTIEDLDEYVSESGNPENEKGVAIVDVELTELRKWGGARLIDTPGIGSVWKHNTETALGWFPETGAVLFVMSAERPISEVEMRLLEDVLRYSPEVYIIITKIDLYSEKQVADIVSFTENALNTNLERSFPLCPFSTVKDTRKHVDKIETSIIGPLLVRVDEVRNTIVRHKASTLIKSCISYLEIARQASKVERGELEKLKKAVFEEHMNAHYVRRELLFILDSYKNETRETLFEYMKEYIKPIIERLTADFLQSFPGWKGTLYSFTKQYEAWIKDSLSSEIKKLLLEEDRSSYIITGAKKHLSFYLKSFRQRLNENISKSLGISMHSEEWGELVFDIRRPDISISRAFDFHLDMFWFLFPMFIFRKIFARFFAGQIPGEVDKNIHRLVSDLTGKIYREMDRMMEQTLLYVNNELKLVESLMERTPDTAGRIDEVKHKLTEMEQLLHE